MTWRSVRCWANHSLAITAKLRKKDHSSGLMLLSRFATESFSPTFVVSSTSARMSRVIAMAITASTKVSNRFRSCWRSTV